MSKKDVGRRDFLKGAAVGALVLPALPLGLAVFGTSEAPGRVSTPDGIGAADGPLNPSWKTVMVDASEPGDPLIMAGTIYGPDGLTPAKRITLYVYHTDNRGYYSNEEASGQPGKPRLRGWMRTNEDGKYEFRTIKAAPYPNGSGPAHIHATLSGPGNAEYWIDMYLFEGDPHLPESHRATLSGRDGFSPVVALQRDGQGVLRGVRNIRLKRV